LWEELINHGHTLILLDGLDEISDGIGRQEIVNHVRKFIDEYVRAPDFISAFDNPTFYDLTQSSSIREFVETQPVWLSGGNQIVVTSRITGYQLNPLSSPLIKHYLLSSMDADQIKKFVCKWIAQVNHSIVEALLNAGIELKDEKVENLSKRRHNSLQAIFESGSVLIMSNAAMLSLICMSIFQSYNVFHLKTRVEVYDYVVQSAVHSFARHQLTISENMLINFLIDLAFYLHSNSPSGLIDEFDLQRLCYLSFQQQGLSNNRLVLREHTKTLLSSLNTNLGIVAERGLQVFSFVHLSFQEYFVARYFVREDSVDKVVKRILTFIIDVRFRESLLLALGWISWKWSSNDYDHF
jgi:predicted NACHT family NTPase